MTKKCKVCGATEESVEFYGSVTSRCKECHKMLVAKNRHEKSDYYRAYDAERYQNDSRVKERHRRYQGTKAGKTAMFHARKRWEAKAPEKKAANIILNNAVRDGKIEKPAFCSVCGASGRIHGHHHDYTKPLDVIWCCARCHRQFHKEE
jgi:hypothetical protein